ncbi:MAG TPA: hypothetical protein VE735_08695 [Gammaproteobacteria bacterium]|nr:hypothetical protein [Gammaproteobacteria bacterium]
MGEARKQAAAQLLKIPQWRSMDQARQHELLTAAAARARRRATQQFKRELLRAGR